MADEEVPQLDAVKDPRDLNGLEEYLKKRGEER
jgi:hypothetical protein